MRKIKCGTGVDPSGLLGIKFKKFRKKPIVISAALLDEPIEIETLEGTMIGNIGDYLIRGISGEYYPCKPEIFNASYEPVEEDSE